MADGEQLAKRLETTRFGIDPKHVHIPSIVNDVEDNLRPGMSTHIINELAIQASLRLSGINSAYIWIASHLEVADMHKAINASFSDSVKNIRDGGGRRHLSGEFMSAVEKHHQVLDAALVHFRDYDLTYDMIKNMQTNLLGRNGDRVVERVQHMYMRIALAIHLDDIPKVLSTYELLSSRLVTHDYFVALYAGTTAKNLTSYYTTGFANSDARDMFEAISRTVFAARDGATVAISAHGVPCSGRNTTCHHEDSNVGLWPMMRFIDGAISFAKRQDDHRADLINICVPTSHIDIRSILEYNNMHRSELADHKSLTITLSLSDTFMSRVNEDGDWSMFCPRDTPDLLRLTGSAYEDAYKTYEASGISRVHMKARDLWHAILRSIILTGGPSIVFRDNISGKSNLTDGHCHTDLRTGMIDASTESDELYPRNHASIELPLFVTHDKQFDLEKLHRVTKETVYNLNKLLDRSIPHLATIMDNNQEYRALAIGMNGLADVFAALRMPYESLEAVDLNVQIAETMYHAALDASCDLAEDHGPYDAFYHSPLSNGILQFDLWEVTPSNAYDWNSLRKRIRASGVRNALLLGIGAGDESARVSGFSGSTDPSTSNVLDGRVICPWLTQELSQLGLWNEDMRESSIQHIRDIPDSLKAIFKTAWEIDQKMVIKMALGRAPYICQSQCISFHMEAPTTDQLVRPHPPPAFNAVHISINNSYYPGRPIDTFPELSASGTSYEGDTDGEMSFDEFIFSGST
ncbi:ribonucleotide reductase [Mycena galericulata]|nr:ribonucleotide reductase [Mycena galericulata]